MGDDSLEDSSGLLLSAVVSFLSSDSTALLEDKKHNKSSKDQSLPWHAASFLNGVRRHKPTFSSLLSILLVIPTYLETTGSQGGGSPSMVKFSAMLTTMHIQIFMGTITLHSFTPRSQTICIITITKHSVRGNSPHMPNMTVTSIYSSFNLTRLQGKAVHERSHHQGQSSARALHIANTEFKPDQMTMPYIHPHLKMPVPPLHLPWYFGAMCWSVALVGVLMLNLPQKWTLYGGRCGLVRRQEQEQYQRHHWFPHRAFAWVLILCQVSTCSAFLCNIMSWLVVNLI